MSVNPYRRKPASLQLIPACAVLDDEIVTSTSQIPRAPEVTGQHIEVLFKKSYPLETIAIQASSPTRSTSRLNGTTTTTGHTTSRNKSPTRTAFVTIVKTTSSPEEANETPPATKTVFFSTTPQIFLVTVTAVPSTTTSAGSLQAQDNEEGSENAPALTQTAKVFLTVLSAIAGVAVLVAIGLIVWKKNKIKRRVKDFKQDLDTPELQERENPLPDPPERQRY